MRELTEVIVRIVVAVVVVPEGAEAALDPDRAGAQEGVGRLAQPQATHLVVHDWKKNNMGLAVNDHNRRGKETGARLCDVELSCLF